MKKTYQTPNVKRLKMDNDNILQASGVKGDGIVDVGYGGTDDQGEKDPSARWSYYSVWDSEEEE